MLAAFATLERQDATLAVLPTQHLGDRQRAARWMGMHQRAFGGRSAYEALADGEIDRVWDRVLGSDDGDAASPLTARLGWTRVLPALRERSPAITPSSAIALCFAQVLVPRNPSKYAAISSGNA